MYSILRDITKFKKVTGDIFSNVIKLEDKLNRLLRGIREKIGINNFNYLFASGTQPGIMYGLPKVHKINTPMRPIISCIKTASYNLAKFLIPVVTPFTTNQYTIENSSSFVREIMTLDLPTDFCMASFDIESLFTNVPLEETTNIILNQYQAENFYGIENNTMKKLLLFATSESIFMFNNQLYNQIDGISMGSCLGPTYANTFMCHHESKWLTDCPLTFKPIYYRRYVDDTFLIFKHPDHIKLFLEYLNSKHNNIKFTCEREVDGSLPFLDINIKKHGNGFKTNVFRKPTHTGLGLNWYSFCPDIYKINSIKTLLNRAYDICSTFELLHNEIETLKTYFLGNNYSQSIFYKTVKDFLYKKRRDDIPICTVPKMVKYIRLPFYGRSSYELRKKINKILKYSFPAVNFKIIFTNNYTIGSFFRIKEKLPDSVCSNVVYEFNCPSCSARYLGCTTRSFNIRVLEHIGKSFRTGQYLNKMPFSAIREHSHTEDHRFSRDDFKIAARFNTTDETLIGEKILINKHKPELNTMH
ncbi:MAG: reverse transcriptase domain-containing protein [Cyanobacteria bacterium J06614_10]